MEDLQAFYDMVEIEMNNTNQLSDINFDQFDNIADLLQVNMDPYLQQLYTPTVISSSSSTASGQQPQNKFILAKTNQEKLYYQNQNKSILKPIYETNVLYVCSEDEWKEKIQNYITLNNTFIPIGEMPSSTLPSRYVQNALDNMKNHVIHTMFDLYSSTSITYEQYQEMKYDEDTSLVLPDINALDFILESSSSPEFHLRPLMTCSAKDPIKSLVSFLKSLLQPLLDQMIYSKNYFRTGYDAINAFDNYAQQGFLQPSTRFIQINIEQISTTLPHSIILQNLENFLSYHLPDASIDGITIPIILQLVKLILENQFYIYENILYQQIVGCSTSSSFMINLIDIYLYQFFHEFSLKLIHQNEIYGRSFNQIILTWNDTNQELINLLTQINLINSNQKPPLIATVIIDQKLHYFDAQISHQQGQLYTKVYHNTDFEPESLPYVFGTNLKTSSSLYETLLLRSAYLRAFLYSSNLVEFEAERMFIDSSFRHNDFSLNFTYQIFRTFLEQYHVTIGKDECINETMYYHVRHNILKLQKKQIKQTQHGRQRRLRELKRNQP